VKSVHGIGILLWETSDTVRDLELEDGWRINDSAIALSKPTGTSCHGLLSNAEGEV
jgi:hypothetical protein